MRYYLLNWEETGNPVPRIRNWMERLDYQAVQRRELAKLLERTILFLEENQDTLFPDVIEKPFLLVSKMFWDVSKMYEVPVRGKKWFCLMVRMALQKFTICQCIPDIIVFQKKPFLIMIIL